jgi:flagellar basal-body rod protein FlgG
MSGGMRALRSLEVLSNNLANVNTTGFKQDTPIFKLHSPAAAAAYGKDSAEARLAQAWSSLDSDATDFTQGTLLTTGNSLDFALNGDGFFALQNTEGKVFLSRDGSFGIDKEGFMISRSGHRVLGADSQSIKLPAGDLVVDDSGVVRVNGAAVATLGVFDVPDRDGLAKMGGNMWTNEGGDALVPAGGQVRQYHLEGSNVEPIRALIELIAVTRYYEAFKNTLNTSSELDQQLNTQVGKIDR